MCIRDSSQGGRPRHENPIASITTGQGINTSDSKIVFADVMKQYGPIGSNYEDDGYVITNIAIPNYTRTWTGSSWGNNPTLTVTLTIQKTTANSMTGGEEGHKFHYNQGLTISGTEIGVLGNDFGTILDDAPNLSGTMNRNVNVFRPNTSDTDPYPETIRVRIRNAGWERFFGPNPTTTAGGVYSFTNGSTYNYGPPATARVKGRWNRVGLFNTCLLYTSPSPRD